jgi:hypothetical protein
MGKIWGTLEPWSLSSSGSGHVCREELLALQASDSGVRHSDHLMKHGPMRDLPSRAEIEEGSLDYRCLRFPSSGSWMKGDSQHRKPLPNAPETGSWKWTRGASHFVDLLIHAASPRADVRVQRNSPPQAERDQSQLLERPIRLGSRRRRHPSSPRRSAARNPLR